MKKNRIEISSKHKNDLAEEFGTTGQHIRMCLQYVFNSEVAKQVRARAKKLLENEAKKVEI